MPEITTNGDTVWVNGNSGCLGRFCKGSYEIMHTNGGQTTHMNNNHEKDWERFVDEMYKQHRVTVLEEHRPSYAR